MTAKRDHGGGIDAAAARWGGTRADWIDLSTGINPVPYPVPTLTGDVWTALPDAAAFARFESAARAFWSVPDTAHMVVASGASALIAAMPTLASKGPVHIPAPTYNEHAASFDAYGFRSGSAATSPTHVYVHPNNPDGRTWPTPKASALTIIDESFCDTLPEASRISEAGQDGVVVLKSFGKFWGLAGLRLGAFFGAKEQADTLRSRIGPWAVSGPALAIGAEALSNLAWAEWTRARLAHDANRLDVLMTRAGATVAGGTTLFRLYDVDDAAAWQERLAQSKIWSRIFPYSDSWLRLGLPASDGWKRLEQAL